MGIPIAFVLAVASLEPGFHTLNKVELFLSTARHFSCSAFVSSFFSAFFSLK